VRTSLQLSAAIDRINAWVGRTMCWFILAAVALAAISAALRKLFHVSSNAWSELQWYLFGAAFLFSAGYVLLKDEHVRVDVMSARWSRTSRCWIDILAFALIGIPICLVMIVLGALHTWYAFKHGERSYMADGLIVWPVRALVPIGFGLLGLQLVSEIIKRVLYLQGRAGDVPETTDPPEATNEAASKVQP
jgi:TRAP-type mannitol/chloroaromatic compound transport system permease small subunit